MSSFQVRCPQCSRLLSAAGSGQVNIRCAACGTVFGVQIAQPVGPAAPPPPPPPPPQSFASFQAVPTPTAVHNLCALGFPEAQARAALRSSDGDVERAATLLLATPRETSHAASPSHAATPAPAGDAEDRELQQALEASRRESQQSSIPVAVALPASAGTTAPVAVAATAVAAGAAAAAAGVRAPPLLNTTVELQSLIRRPELNGQQGIAETWEHGRYQARYLRKEGRKEGIIGHANASTPSYHPSRDMGAWAVPGALPSYHPSRDMGAWAVPGAAAVLAVAVLRLSIHTVTDAAADRA